MVMLCSEGEACWRIEVIDQLLVLFRYCSRCQIGQVRDPFMWVCFRSYFHLHRHNSLPAIRFLSTTSWLWPSPEATIRWWKKFLGMSVIIYWKILNMVPLRERSRICSSFRRWTTSMWLLERRCGFQHRNLLNTVNCICITSTLRKNILMSSSFG